jgi:hypothetical protein
MDDKRASDNYPTREDAADTVEVPVLRDQDRSSLAKLSPYFTIAAAAAGLISDGCMYSVLSSLSGIGSNGGYDRPE